MNKASIHLDTLHRLSITAGEEASRLGERTMDIDHLFLALTLSDQTAGQVLRSLGLTLDAARRALAEQREDALATLGLTLDAPEPGPITYADGGDYAWSDRAQAVLRRSTEKNHAAGRKKPGDAAAILRALLDEPSGLITDLVQRMGGGPEAIVHALDGAESLTIHRTTPATTTGYLSTAEAFLPAPIATVWALLADPARRPEWDEAVESIEVPQEAEVLPGDAWLAHAPTHLPSGKPLAIKPELARQSVEVTAIVPRTHVAWTVSYPDSATANQRVTVFDLEAAAGGTQVWITHGWQPRAGRKPRPVRRALLSPLVKASLWFQVRSVASAVSRALR
ncbi:MAG: Clp protease N-terminal domain-containing protein [Dermabacter sp.]|nr:Clp protease N-terminal domain-containing protein [Dermabacter sp.]